MHSQRLYIHATIPNFFWSKVLFEIWMEKIKVTLRWPDPCQYLMRPRDIFISLPTQRDPCWPLPSFSLPLLPFYTNRPLSTFADAYQHMTMTQQFTPDAPLTPTDPFKSRTSPIDLFPQCGYQLLSFLVVVLLLGLSLLLWCKYSDNKHLSIQYIQKNKWK